MIDKGREALIEAVDAGKVSINTAATIATQSKDEQEEIVARGEKEILQAAKEIRGKKVEKKKHFGGANAGFPTIAQSGGLVSIPRHQRD